MMCATLVLSAPCQTRHSALSVDLTCDVVQAWLPAKENPDALQPPCSFHSASMGPPTLLVSFLKSTSPGTGMPT